MALERVAPRYAKSLLDLALQQGEIDRTVSDVKAFRSALSSHDLKLFLKSPIIKSGKKLDVFKKSFEGKFSPLVNKFFEIIIKKGREPILAEITQSFLDLYRNHEGISIVKLTSAKPMQDETLAKINQMLSQSTETRQKVELETSVDENLIGGFKLEIEDKLYDASVAYKLEQIRKEFS